MVATAGSETLTGGAGSDTFTVNANATASIVGFNSSDTLNVLAAGVADIALASTVAGQIFDFTALALGTVNLTDASTTGNTFKLDVAATAKEAFNLTQTGTATDTVVGYRTGDVLTATHGSITLNVSGSITTSHDTDLVGVSLINATAKNTSIDLHNQTESFTLGSVGITSLSGDVFTSSQALDHYTVNDAGTGITATTLLKINDVTGVGAAIDYVTGASHTTSALTVGKTTSSSVTFDAKGNVTNFATTPTTLSAALTAIAKAFATEGTTPHLAAANATHGEFAIFKLGTNEYVYISHGNETTSGATDTLIQLVGVTSVSSVDITGIGSGHLVIHA